MGHFSTFPIKLSEEKKTKGCLLLISLINAGISIAGAVFFLNGSNIILVTVINNSKIVTENDINNYYYENNKCLKFI